MLLTMTFDCQKEKSECPIADRLSVVSPLLVHVSLE